MGNCCGKKTNNFSSLDAGRISFGHHIKRKLGYNNYNMNYRGYDNQFNNICNNNQYNNQYRQYYINNKYTGQVYGNQNNDCNINEDDPLKNYLMNGNNGEFNWGRNNKNINNSPSYATDNRTTLGKISQYDFLSSLTDVHKTVKLRNESQVRGSNEAMSVNSNIPMMKSINDEVRNGCKKSGRDLKERGGESYVNDPGDTDIKVNANVNSVNERGINDGCLGIGNDFNERIGENNGDNVSCKRLSMEYNSGSNCNYYGSFINKNSNGNEI